MIQIMAAQKSIQEIIRLAQEGDKSAYAELTALYRDRVEALASSLMVPSLRRQLPVEDVLQETLARGFENLKRFQWKGDDSFLRWLGAIARNVIARAAKRDYGVTGLELTLVATGSAPSPSKAMRREERFERLENAIARLTPEQRQVIQLSRMEGLKIREISEQTGRTPDAVKQLLLRGLRSLKRNFGHTESLRLPKRSLDPKIFDGQEEQDA
jgi:RNA polymerase sigma-70 factor (ECF subfamily)